MKKKIGMLLGLLAMGLLLAACGDNEEEQNADELKQLNVDFDPPEEVDVGETVELEATVTYGDEKVTDAEEMEFEYWKHGDRDNGTFEDGENNDDGTYTLDVSFEEDGVHEVYAHTTAEGTHTMPKAYIAVGDATMEDVEEAKEENKNGDDDGMNNMDDMDDEDDNEA